MAGQAISISGLFALVTSLFIASIAGQFDRRHVLVGLTGVMLASLVLIAVAPKLLGPDDRPRSLQGIVIGGFWSLATAPSCDSCRRILFRKRSVLSTPVMRWRLPLPRRSVATSEE